jgi:hypothetical protein
MSKPGPKEPNERIHADLFDPITTDNKEMHLVLSLTNTFTGRAVVTAIENKDLTTIAHAILNSWFRKFGVAKQLQITTSKVLVTKIADIIHQEAHFHNMEAPTCKTQPEPFNNRRMEIYQSNINFDDLSCEDLMPLLIFAQNIGQTPQHLAYNSRIPRRSHAAPKGFQTARKTWSHRKSTNWLWHQNSLISMTPINAIFNMPQLYQPNLRSLPI